MPEAYALGFGIVFLIMGVLGFIPPFASGGMLVGIFLLGSFRGIVHLLIVGVALAAYSLSEHASRQFFQVLGMIYAAIASLGLFSGSAGLLGIMASRWADLWLHVLIASSALYLGFAYRERSAGASPGEISTSEIRS
jgi:hypothetical protein